VEPATGVTFAGLFKLVQEGIIKPDDVVVVNCSGHTLPVETEILGEQWQRTFDLSQRTKTAVMPEEGLLSALQHMDNRVRRIVVIEDNPDAARLIQRILLANGSYEVQVAHDGQAGIEAVRETRPDMVITDLMMPDVDGFAVIETMKADPELNQIPIVVVTAKELTARERVRLEGQVEMLLQKGSSLDDTIIENLVTKLK
jgi:threonine synthase